MAYSSNDPANYVAVGKQTAIDTEATSFKFVKWLNDDVMSADKDTDSVYEGGDGQDQGLHYQKFVKADGSIETFARPDTFTYLAAWAMGSGVTPASAATADVASHIYTPNATLPALTVEQCFGGGQDIERVSNAIISGFTVEGEAGLPWKLTVPFIGGGTYYYRDGSASALSPAVESGDPAMYNNTINLIDGATSYDVRKWNFNFERGVDDNLFTNQMFRRAVVPLTRQLTVTAEIIYQNHNLWKKIQYGQTTASMVPVNLATGAFSAAVSLASSQQLRLDVPLLRYTSVSVNKLSPDGQTLILNVTGRAVKGATGICQIGANICGRATSYLLP